MIGKRFDAKIYTVRLKATIQSTGKLGFTADTMDQLKLTADCSVYLAPDDENKKVMKGEYLTPSKKPVMQRGMATFSPEYYEQLDEIYEFYRNDNGNNTYDLCMKQIMAYYGL